jgi:hypothetical protein
MDEEKIIFTWNFDMHRTLANRSHTPLLIKPTEEK